MLCGTKIAMLKLYREITQSCPNHTEDKCCDTPVLTERHLQIAWLEQKFFKNLVTPEGVPIEVISPGIWNLESGPDFLRAHFRINGRDYRGDVEIHLQESGWYLHGHHCDPAYNRVVLHLSYRSTTQSVAINKENGQQPFTCDLNQCLCLSPEEILSAIDFDFYPNRIISDKGYCADMLFQQMQEEQIQKFFQSAAYWRLEKKLNFLQTASSEPYIQLGSGIAMALGYKHNSKAFYELFFYLLKHRDLPWHELFAIALGCSGFFEERFQKKWMGSPYYQNLLSLWLGRKAEADLQINLKLDHIRPLNHPTRRLAYLIYLLQDPHFEYLPLHMKRVWEIGSVSATSKGAIQKLKNSLLEVIPSYADDYWEYHYTFEVRSKARGLTFLGTDLKMHILLNTMLPLIYLDLKGVMKEDRWERFRQFYFELDAPLTSKNQYLGQRFFGDADTRYFDKAQMVQGAYQLYHDFCLHYEASCNGCPFVRRYQAIFHGCD